MSHVSISISIYLSIYLSSLERYASDVTLPVCRRSHMLGFHLISTKMKEKQNTAITHIIPQ